MLARARVLVVWATVMIVAGALLAACSQDNKDEDKVKRTVKVKILVLRDGLFNFQVDDAIGEVEFSKYRGPVGSMVEAVARINNLSTFTDRKVNVRLELRNQDATKSGFEPIDWVQDANRRSFKFYVPQVETVPVLLNFRLRVYEFADGGTLPPFGGGDDVDDDTDDDVADDDAADDDADDDVDDDADDDADDDVDDDTDDDADAANEPEFEAAADFVFTVNSGGPGIGD